MKILRWILVPFAWVAAFMAGNLLASIFNADLLLYATGPFAAVLAGSATAPSHQRETAFVLAGLTALLVGLGAAGFFYSEKWFKGILSVIGALVPFFAAASVQSEKP